MKKLIIVALAALSLSTLAVQAEEKQATYSDYNKALLQVGVDPEIAAVVSQITLTKVHEMEQEKQQSGGQ